MKTVIYASFEWDEKKAILNEKDHHITFIEATSAWVDPHNYVVSDARHPERFILIGMSNRERLLFVVHAEVIFDNEGNQRTRIISARKATKKERLEYTGGSK